jgi:prepilin-type N-terminal cleavage/methylation domain-containing protein
MRKIKAFTLFELLVTLSIASLLIGFAFTAFLNYKTLFDRAGIILNRDNEIHTISRMLQRDVIKAKSIHYTREFLTIFNGEDSIRYKIDSAMIYRSAQRTDGFHARISNLEIAEIEDTELVGEIQIGILQGNDTLSMRFSKEYDVRSILEAEEQ